MCSCKKRSSYVCSLRWGRRDSYGLTTESRRHGHIMVLDVARVLLLILSPEPQAPGRGRFPLPTPNAQVTQPLYKNWELKG